VKLVSRVARHTIFDIEAVLRRVTSRKCYKQYTHRFYLHDLRKYLVQLVSSSLGMHVQAEAFLLADLGSPKLKQQPLSAPRLTILELVSR